MCTVLRMRSEEGFFLVKNNDTFFEEGILFTNKRGVRKSALIMPPGIPLKWVSKYGSVSFSQCGKELPVGGMNEVGLVVEQATLPDTVYPKSQGLQGVGELQLIQVLLDTCATTREAIKMIEQVDICQPTWVIHYALMDSSGDMAIIEYVNGERIIYYGDGLPIKALANSRYDKAKSLCKHNRTSLSQEDEYERNSLNRFVQAAYCSASTNVFDINSAFSTLEKLERTDTVWNLVYQPDAMIIYFRTKNSQGIKSIDLGKIDFDSESESLMFTLSNATEGNINHKLQKYSREKNGELINKFFRNEVAVSVMNLAVPDELLNYLTLYPEGLEATD